MEERKKEIKLNENDARNSNRIRRRPTNIGHFRYQNRMPMRQRSEHIGCSVCCVRRQWPHEWKGKKSRHFLCHLSRDTFKIHYRRTLYRIINYVYVERASRSKLYTFALNRPPPSTSRTHTYIVIGVAQKPTTATERKIEKKTKMKIDDTKTTYVSVFIIISGNSERMSLRCERCEDNTNEIKKIQTNTNTKTSTRENRLAHGLHSWWWYGSHSGVRIHSDWRRWHKNERNARARDKNFQFVKYSRSTSSGRLGKISIQECNVICSSPSLAHH